MSIKIMSMVFERYPNGGGEMLLALSLADFAEDDGTRVFPSIKQLAEKTRQSERTVQYQLRKMEESGWLILANSGNGGRNQRREYVINPAWIKGADFAPVQSTTRKGATDDIKGAIHDKKGCNGLHPHIPTIDPSIPVNESPTRAKLALPDWLPLETWAMWDRFRKRKSAKAWTDDAKALSLRTLERLRAEGQDPTAIVEQSIERGWTGLFPLKTETVAVLSKQDRRNAWMREAAGTGRQEVDMGVIDATVA